MSKKVYYFIEDDYWGQRGYNIETTLLSIKEYKQVERTRLLDNRRGFICKSYNEAIEYIND